METEEQEPETGSEDTVESAGQPSDGHGQPATDDSGESHEDLGRVSPEFAKALQRHRARHRALLPDAWRVQLPVFEGPLDLLLHLVRVNEVEITDIPVALVCDQYHAYLDLMEELDLDIAAEYIYEAALLIQLKSRLLLPQPKVEEGEEVPEDPRNELVQRLLEYQKIKEVAETLAEVSSVRLGLWTREPQKIDLGVDEDAELDLGNLSLYDLLKVFRNVLERFDRENPAPIALRAESFLVRDQIRVFLEILDREKPLDLMDHLLSASCRAEAIAMFLAVLEMGKMGLIGFAATQSGALGLVRSERQVNQLELESITS